MRTSRPPRGLARTGSPAVQRPWWWSRHPIRTAVPSHGAGRCSTRAVDRVSSTRRERDPLHPGSSSRTPSSGRLRRTTHGRQWTPVLIEQLDVGERVTRAVVREDIAHTLAVDRETGNGQSTGLMAGSSAYWLLADSTVKPTSSGRAMDREDADDCAENAQPVRGTHRPRPHWTLKIDRDAVRTTPPT